MGLTLCTRPSCNDEHVGFEVHQFLPFTVRWYNWGSKWHFVSNLTCPLMWLFLQFLQTWELDQEPSHGHHLCEDHMTTWDTACPLTNCCLTSERRWLQQPVTSYMTSSDYVLIKNFRRKNWPQSSCSVTYTAVKVTTRTRWVHMIHCRKITEPENTQNSSLLQLGNS